MQQNKGFYSFMVLWLKYSTLALKPFSPIIIIAIILSACEEDQSAELKQQLIAEKVEERVQRLMENKRIRCRDELMENANQIVDSILIAKAKASKDTIGKPPKPFKPEQPDAFLLEDTFAIQPLLRDSIVEDSLTVNENYNQNEKSN
ncbi:MAG: hypothetical protein AAF806_02140 [Bacteroidota bacterium]